MSDSCASSLFIGNNVNGDCYGKKSKEGPE